MKTADLIATLSAEAAPVAPVSPARRLATPVAVGCLITLAIVLLWLGHRPLHEAMRMHRSG